MSIGRPIAPAPRVGRRTKIMATIGPASSSPAMLRELIGAGMDAARVSLAHGDVRDSVALIGRIRGAASALGRHVTVLVDLPGPKVRAAPFPEGGAGVEAGDTLELVPTDGSGSSAARRIGVEYSSLLEDLRAGDTVALGDGGVTMVIEDVTAHAAMARVRVGGWLQGKPGVNLPPGRLTVAVPTPKDLRLLDAVLEAEVDAVAISFVRSNDDVAAAKAAVGADGPMVVAKIELPSAVDDIEGIIQTADGVMVARGDLGVRCRLEDVPHIQKRIIRRGVSWGRPVITATQMLESMVHSQTPTRAEVSDVANAVFDGTSALMLSGETAIGSDPANVVRTMARIAQRAEQDFDYRGWGIGLGRQQTAEVADAPPMVRIGAAITAAAWRAAIDAEVAAIICCTRSGATARAISRFRPTVPLLAVTPSLRTARQLAMAWGVQSAVSAERPTTDEMVWFAVEEASRAGLAKPGDIVAVLAGSPNEQEATTDVLRLVRMR
ncbi:MAG: pyruvate kinase [Actinobacteria bacterium]|nr:pyruvate kinase [Actinomycetota bacterium]